MSQVSQQEHFTSNRSETEILDAASAVLQKLGGKLSMQEHLISVSLGSQGKTRLLGGMFLSNQSLPTKVTVEVQEGKSERRIFVTAEDRIGFGSAAGLVSRYQTWCAQLSKRVRDDMQYELGGEK